MLNAVISWSLRHRVAVVLVWMGVAAAGVLAFRRLPIDAFPDTTPVQVQVNTVAPALSPLEIERQITGPVEQVLSGLPGSARGPLDVALRLSQVTVTFEDGTDIYLARQVVSERLPRSTSRAASTAPRWGRSPPAWARSSTTSSPATASAGRAAHRPGLDHQAPAPLGARRRRGQHVGRRGAPVEVVVDPERPATARPHARQTRRSHRARQPERRRRAHRPAPARPRLLQGLGSSAAPRTWRGWSSAAATGCRCGSRDVAASSRATRSAAGAVTADGQGEAVLGLGFMLMGENSHEVTGRPPLRLGEVRRFLPPGIEVEVGLRAHDARRPGHPHRAQTTSPRARSRHRRAVRSSSATCAPA
jgi:cobalt-zinc-cadmium resistance protein CzcA